jgi:CubicO group peptidase (beta-lactamase class C family)
MLKKNILISNILTVIFLVFHQFIYFNSIGRNYENVFPLESEVEFIHRSIPTYPDTLTFNISHKIDSTFNLANKRYDFHGSILVAKNGKLIHTSEYGYADFNNKTELNSNSAFQLASVSKQFTAAAVLLLYERNQINLDDTVTKYLPELPYNGITIRQLLNHTSGLPMYFWLAEHKWEKEIAPTNTEMIAMMGEYDLPLYFRPGRKFDYSNSGYFILAALVEKVSGKSFGAFIETNIFKPLHMSNSFVYSYGHDSVKNNQLWGYRTYKRKWHMKISGTVNDGIVGDKNIYSTAEDMLRWINALNNGWIISKNTLTQMYAKGETRYGRKVPYGFGFRISNRESGKVIYHDGKWNGFRTSIRQYPERDLVIILLEHSSYRSPSYLINKVDAIVEENFGG